MKYFSENTNSILRTAIALLLAAFAFTYSAQAAVVLNETFPGTSLNTSNWTAQTLSGSVAVNNGATLSGAGAWNDLYLASASSFNRTNGSGGLLRVTFDISDLQDFANFGIFQSGTTFEYTQSPGFCWAPNAGGANTYAMNGFNDFSSSGGFGIPANVMFRITVGETKGALWEYNLKDGNGWHTSRDNRDTSGDASASYQVLAMSGPSGGTWKLNSVVVEYIGGSNVVLNDSFPGTSLNTSNWAAQTLSGSVAVNNGATLSGAGAWNDLYLASANSFNRTDGADGLLRVTFDISDLQDFANFGIFQSGTTFEYTQSPGFCWAPNAGGANTYAMNGFNDFSFSGGFGIPANVIFRITVGATKGALWEYNLKDGNGWHTSRDNRDTSGDASASYQVLAMSGPSGGTWKLNSVVVEYFAETTGPTEPAFATSLLDNFSGDTLSTATWKAQVVPPATLTVDNELLMQGGPGWERCGLISQEQFARLDENSGTLRLTVSLRFDDFTEGAIGLMPTRSDLERASMPGYSLMGIYSDNQIYAMDGFNDITVPANVSLPTTPLQLRITVGMVKGALYELKLDNQNYQTVRDTRGQSGNAAAAYQVVLMSTSPGEGLGMHVTQIQVDYVGGIQPNAVKDWLLFE